MDKPNTNQNTPVQITEWLCHQTDLSSLEEVKEKTEKELELRNATFRYSNWLND